jgi:PAS domain S-box-containing protein
MTDYRNPNDTSEPCNNTKPTDTQTESLPYSILRRSVINKIGHFGEWEWIVATNEVYWSKEMYEIFGIEPGTVIDAETSINAFHPDDRQNLIQITQMALKTGNAQLIEARILMQDGAIKYVQGTGEAILDENGKLERMIGFYQDITEQKKTYLELERTKKFYESLIRKAPDGVVLIGMNGAFTYASPSARKLFGYSPESDITDNPDDLTHPDDLPMVLESLYKVINNPAYTPMIEYRFRHNSGEWLWVESIFTNMLSEPGVEGIVINFREITHKKLIEQKQTESESRFRLLFETMQEGVVFVDNDDIIQYINKKCCDIYGYNQEDMIGKVGNEYLILEEDRHIIIEKNRVRIDGISDEYEIRGKKTNGDLIWLRISGAPIKDKEGIVIGSVGIMTDVTTQKLALDALKNSEEKYRLLFDSMLEGFALHEIICDNNDVPIDYRFLMVNPSFEKLTTLKAEQIIGKTVLEVMPNTEKYWIDTYGKVALTGEPISYENYSQVLKKHYKVTAYQTNYKQFAVLIEDITESKNLKDQLLASQKMEAIGQLAGGVAHDFNNLLTVILGYGEEIIKNLKNDLHLTKDVQEIVKAGKRAASLTQQLLTFSRKQVIQPQILDINLIVENMYGMLARLIGEHINFKLSLADDLKCIKADPGQMEQVVLNLVLNARDAMPEGGLLHIETSLIDCDQHFADQHPNICPGNCVMITISDTGLGMNEEVKSHIFEPFYTTKETGKGLGLGLATVYGIIKRIHGHITVDSEPSKGTSIKIMLPATDEQPQVVTAQQHNLDLTGKGQKIMVVEDEESLCALISKMLTDLGYNPVVFSHSKDALAYFEQGYRPDLIVTDVVMPELNGKQLIDKIRQINPEQKVLFMSGFTDETIAHHGVLDDDAPFIQKPFASSDIAFHIYQLLYPQTPASSKKLSIMILDDEEDIRILAGRACRKKGFDFYDASELKEALKILSENTIDILLIDFNLIGMSGFDALQEIRDKGFNQPAVILTGAVTDDIVKSAADYNVVKVLEKSFDFQALLTEIESISL